jgi:DNA modification methylase
MHDGSDAVTGVFPNSKVGAMKSSYIMKECENKAMSGKNYEREMPDVPASEGSAARFFYCPKVSKSERGVNNNHPTVKPIKLMEYLCRLVTPKGGIVLDPFMGSGTTIMAAKNGGFKYIGIEKEKEYFEIANSRIDNQPKNLVDFL